MSLNAFIKKHGIKLVELEAEDHNPVFLTLDRTYFTSWKVVLSRDPVGDEFSPFFSAPQIARTITLHTAFAKEDGPPTLLTILLDQWEDIMSSNNPDNTFEEWIVFRDPNNPNDRPQWDAMNAQTLLMKEWLAPDLDEFIGSFELGQLPEEETHIVTPLPDIQWRITTTNDVGTTTTAGHATVHLDEPW